LFNQTIVSPTAAVLGFGLNDCVPAVPTMLIVTGGGGGGGGGGSGAGGAGSGGGGGVSSCRPVTPRPASPEGAVALGAWHALRAAAHASAKNGRRRDLFIMVVVSRSRR
jgi:hypothetical protein